MKITPKYWLILILILAAFLRFFQFDKTDVYTDEVLIAIRSIGMIDFSVSQVQPSPWQLVDSVPGWMHLSMHDHPILTFLVQHVFFNIFGINAWGLRLWAVLSGIAAVYLVYLLGKKLFNEKIGLWAAVLLALNPYHVWVSRVGLQEALVILLILLAFYYFLKSLNNKKNLLITFILLGVCFIAKYTTFILLPIFFIIVLQQKQFKNFFTSKYFWLGIIILLIILSPSIIYNLRTQQTFNHLDFQLSGLLKQNVPEWPVHYGRELTGNLSQKITDLPVRLKDGLSWPALIIFLISYLFLIWRWLKTKNASFFILTLVVLIWLWWFLIIGPTRRFMSYLMPWLSLVVAWAAINLFQKIKSGLLKKGLSGLAGILIIFEIFFLINTFYVVQPKGTAAVLWAKVHYEIKDHGFNALDNYFKQLLYQRVPLASFPPRYQFLEEIKTSALKEMKNKNYRPAPILIIYDANIFDLGAAWIFHRRAIYEGWPILDAQTYIETLKNEGNDIFQKSGIKNFYFVSPTPQAYLEYKKPLTDWGKKLESILIKNNVQPDNLLDRRGQIVFKIYKF